MWLARFASRALNSAFARSSSTGSAPGEPKPGLGVADERQRVDLASLGFDQDPDVA